MRGGIGGHSLLLLPQKHLSATRSDLSLLSKLSLRAIARRRIVEPPDQESARRDKMGTRPNRVVAGRRSTSNDRRRRPSVNFDSKRARVTCHRQSPPDRFVRVSSPRSPINSIVTIAYANIPNFPTKFTALYRSSDTLKRWIGN